MNTILSKIKSHSSRSNSIVESKKNADQSARISIQEENVLADEQDSTTGGIGGMLTISDELLKTPTDSTKDFAYEVPCDGSCGSSSNVTFEVISAEVVRDGRSGHVNYTVLINPHTDTSKAPQTVVIRRYSDFEQLHHLLKKKFPNTMSQISFPRKILTGNFTSETIAKRSTAFEQYLSHLFSYFEIRYCREFMEFFIQDDLTVAIQSFLDKKYVYAATYFNKIIPVLEKLYGDSHPHVFHCLCGLVVSRMNTDKTEAALACAEVALKCSGAADDETLTALILATIRLCWTLGKDKKDLEKKLQTMRDRGVDTNSVKDLGDILQETFRLRTLKGEK